MSGQRKHGSLETHIFEATLRTPSDRGQFHFIPSPNTNSFHTSSPLRENAADKTQDTKKKHKKQPASRMNYMRVRLVF